MSFLVSRLKSYALLIRLHKPIGTLLLLWPTLWALWMASNGDVSFHLFLVFTVGTFLMRSAGCAINDYADRNYDPHVKRTQYRPLASGQIKSIEAVSVALVLSAFAFMLVLTLNRLTISLSFIALFLAVTYPFTKRFFVIPQAYLGIAFGFGIPMAWAAQTNELSLTTWIILLANIFWAVAYDTEYAMVDRDDDLKLGIHTTAILFGKYDVLAVFVCHTIFIAGLALAGSLNHSGVLFYIGLLGALIALSFQYPMIAGRERDGCFRAFNHNNLVGGIVFMGIFLDSVMNI
jgi:4-hydroxybenzoate polyprenyltransferase